MSNISLQIKGGLWGFCVGDALGVPYEFITRNSMKQCPAIGYTGFGSHNVPEGTWSDDSSLTFCTAESLVDGYNLKEIATSFVKWYYNGYWTPYGKVFDVGLTTKIAIQNLKNGINPYQSGLSGKYNNGNGSLMRILPIAFYLSNIQNKHRYKIIKEVSSITHPNQTSIIGCFLYVYIAIGLINKLTLKESMRFAAENACSVEFEHSLLQPYKRILTETIGEVSSNEIKSSGFVVDTLESIIWCLSRSQHYQEAVLLAVNLGEDTDTIGALTGGLAGIIYGYSNIPQTWIRNIARYNDVDKLIERFSNSPWACD